MFAELFGAEQLVILSQIIFILAKKNATNNLSLPRFKKEYSFFEDVYDVVRQIPKGRVTSYGAIANYLGTKLSARMVGWAMNASHNRDDVPAHRVVNRLGLLSGKHHFDGTNLMQQLLESEGVEVVDNQIVGFKKYFWEPDF